MADQTTTATDAFAARRAFADHESMCNECSFEDADEVEGCDVGAALWSAYRDAC